MKLWKIHDDTRGASLVEATVTIPLLLLLTFGLVQAGLLLWVYIGLQHGVDMAARCASVYDAAKYANWPSSLCLGTDPTKTALSTSSIASYAANNSLGINPPATTFTINLASAGTVCSNGIPGNQVSVSNYTPFDLNYIFIDIKFNVRSCYPTTT